MERRRSVGYWVAAGAVALVAAQIWRLRGSGGLAAGPVRASRAAARRDSGLARVLAEAGLAAALGIAMGLRPIGALRVGARHMGRRLAGNRERQ